MAKIESGRWSEQLRRMFGMAGQELVAADLSPEVSPIVILEGQSVEWNFLKSVRDVYVGQLVNLPAAGFLSKWRFRNPALSGVAATFEYIELTPEAANARMAIRINAQLTDFATSQPTTVPDTRWGPLTTGRSALVASFQNTNATVPAGQTIALSRTLNGVPWQYPKEIFIPPGVTLDVGTDTVNVQMYGTFKWRERQFPVLER